MINFKPVEITDRHWIQPVLEGAGYFGCEYCFGNIFMWSAANDIRVALSHGFFVERFEGYYLYPVKIKTENSRAINSVISALIEDAEKQKKKFGLFGITDETKEELEKEMPGRFIFKVRPNSTDYIYLTEDLIHLKGRKYQSKRNHIARFCENNPDWKYEEIKENNINECIEFTKKWIGEKSQEKRPGITSEKAAIGKALANYDKLSFKGGLLRADKNGKIIAYTFGELINENIFCIHVEKAVAEIQGAYPMINRLFCENTISKYKYVNREEDMGIEGLRKAKQSYHPVILLNKYTAKLKNNIHPQEKHNDKIC